MTDTMTNVERVRAILRFQPFDRLPIVEWASWWDKTIDRWHGEGLPPELTDRYDICRHFGLDVLKQDWLRQRTDGCPEPASHGAGICADEADYERLRPCLYPDDVVDKAKWAAWADEQARGEVALWFTVDGFFWHPRMLFGIERHFYAFYDQPALMHRMNEDLAAWELKVIDDICSVCTPEFITFAEDMSYNHGPMLSKALFDEFLAPYYRRVVPEIRRRGVVPILDSDGDITVPIAWYAETGVEGFLPLERQSGVDVARLRELYPRQVLIGAFDKMTMNRGVDAMEAEFQRLLPTARAGGLIVSCDHQTPPGVSYAQYLDYLELFRKYAPLAGA
ncbi:MAG TPA: uroporphyrinogen decarboxylase family protein [Phycisphaerae bacterium]|nr:uroporphyrinogen decarboxylase family protein [Phycisphaerae bacterium]